MISNSKVVEDPFTKVYLDIDSTLTLHPFFHCTLDLFGHQTEHICNVAVDLDIEKNRIVLRRPLESDLKERKVIPLEHAPQCPVRYLAANSQLKSKEHQPFVRIGVAILVENEKEEVFITRRAPHMRTCKYY
jgi:hypothetical protein